ncbi:MAG: hypothetical protein RLZZ461_22 [Planctomycetota bacterium]|jgi:hypothetical protein
MPKIAHVQLEAGETSIGVLEKHDSMLSAWTDAGIDWIDLRPRIEAGGLGRLGVLLSLERAAGEVRRRLDEFSPDLVYMRETPWTPSVERIFRRHRVVIEANGDVATQLRARSPWAARYVLATSGRLHGRVSAVVGVTDELARSIGPASIPRMVSGNPVRVPDVRPPRREHEVPTVVMLLGERAGRPVPPSRGLDRLAMLAAALPEIRFVVHGDGDVPESCAGSKIEFRPAVARDALLEVLRDATVGMGSLAPHRSGLTEVRSLKVRTTLAAGLPLIHASPDPDLPESTPFILKLPSRDDLTSEDVERVRTFVRCCHEEDSRGEGAWEFARQRLSHRVIEGERLVFLRSLCGGRGS